MIVEAQGRVAVLAVDASPTRGGRTRAALDAVSSAAAQAGAVVETIGLGDGGSGLQPVLSALASAEAVVLASPVYRASFAAPLKQLLDAVPREAPPSLRSPLRAKAIAVVYSGASLHHFLALDSLRGILAGFFAAHVVPPGLYVPGEAFDEELALREPYAEHARLQGAALVAFARVLRDSPVLTALRPQA